MAETNPNNNVKLKTKIKKALNAFNNGNLHMQGQAFFNALGYISERVPKLDNQPQSFINRFVPHTGQSGTITEKFFLETAETVHVIFQVTDEEIHSSDKSDRLEGARFDENRDKSFLFMTIKLKPGNYARGKYAEMTREINKRLAPPTVVLFLNDDKVTLAFIARREHKTQKDRDVLGKVSMIRDIDCNNPHRAHLDILAELSIDDRLKWIKENDQQKDFAGLLAAWLAKLDTEELNKRFYDDLFKWFQLVVKEATFPSKGNKALKPEEHVIRLITRMLFVWFIKEKGLVANDLFNETKIVALLKKYDHKNGDSYYRAVLQNLFFATLNTEIGDRGFSKVENSTHRNFNLYRYKDLLADPKELLRLMEQTPFINGGLFDCLDSELASSEGGYRIDCFSDNRHHRKMISIPNRLFFSNSTGLFPLLNKYKFTVEENTPIEQEVALDPELLGKVFENLLAAHNLETRDTVRKQTGSYYTPREIVDYMADQSLVESLAEQVTPADNDMEFWKERLYYLLDYAATFDDAQELFNEQEKHDIIRAIAKIKVLDPAVGSGAFPMGILHKLTLALRRIDPHNQGWEALQKQYAGKRATAAFDTKEKKARNEQLKEISETFDQYRDSDFGRKLYLIQNGIFGVDTKPEACQIAKLRFFISLTIEQQPNDNQNDNYGIKPLPNLETRFVVADTLIGLQLAEGNILKSEEIEKLIEQLQQNREQHFNANTRQKKLNCNKKDKKLRHQLATALEAHYKHNAVWTEAQHIVDAEIKKLNSQFVKYRLKVEASKQTSLLPGDKVPKHQHNYWEKIAELETSIEKKGTQVKDISKKANSIKSDKVWGEAEKLAEKKNQMIHGEAQKISEWDLYDQNAKADWFDPELMFGVTSGFDVVIGNPPYIQLQKNDGELGKRYVKCGFQSFTGSGDIYQLFYEKGLDLLKIKTGVLSFITSNSWLRAGYGKKLRQFFVDQHNPLQLIDMGKDVFESAVVDSSIFMIAEGVKNQAFSFKAIDMDTEDNFPPEKSNWKQIYPQEDQPWSVLSPEEQTITQKIAKVGISLKNWDTSICRGVTTGYNEAFIIDTKTKEALVAQDPKSVEILKPMLRGRDIKCYQAQWAGKWLIATLPSLHINIENYPAIKRHLLSCGKDRLEQTGETLAGGSKSRKKTPHQWFELQDVCAYYADFEKEKLAWIELVDRGRFAYDNQGMYYNNTASMVTGNNIKYLCAFLNSRLASWILKTIAGSSGMGTLRWMKICVEAIPIPEISQAKQQPYIELIDKIIEAKTNNPDADTNKLEADIDELVYGLYDLTDKETTIIEGNI